MTKAVPFFFQALPHLNAFRDCLSQPLRSHQSQSQPGRQPGTEPSAQQPQHSAPVPPVCRGYGRRFQLYALTDHHPDI